MKSLLYIAIFAIVSSICYAEKTSRPQKNDKPQIERPVPKPTFPRHWGHPPKIQTRDHVKLPGKFGFGSSTLARWISENIKKDTKPGKPEVIDPREPGTKPVRPKRPAPSIDVKEKIAIVMAKEKEMHQIRRSFHETLRSSKDGSKETREVLIKEFREANAEKHKALKEAQKELQKKIRETKQEGARRK
jgi:hypothetical protein